jgi:hypothetical protein
MRSNYLRGGITYASAYIDNLYVNTGSTSVAERTTAIFPSIEFDATTARQHLLTSYSGGFTFFSPSSSLNEMDNNATVDYSFQVLPHTMIKGVEQFQESSSPNLTSEATVSGAPLTSTPGAVPAFAKMLANYTAAEITQQTGLNTMIGASGLWTTLDYPNPSQAPDLSNSNARGVSGFYNYRASRSQYVGAIYQYADMRTYPEGAPNITTTSTVMGYYTVYIKTGLSLSVAGGPQYYHATYPQLPVVGGWAPSVTASVGWQANHINFATSYSQSVTGGGGLLGTYHSRTAGMTAQWRLARTWTAALSGGYSINTTMGREFSYDAENGHSLSGAVSLQHPIRERIALGFGYQRVHESYGEIAAIAPNPNSGRLSVEVTWNFLRSLGR